MSENETVSRLKERIASVNYFNMTPDDYINKLSDIYYDNMFRTLENFYMKLGDETKREEKLEIIKTVYEKFENRLTQQFDCLEELCTWAVFRVPKHVSLPNEKEINEAIKNFSTDENHKITTKIKELEMSIKQKQMYARSLKSNIEIIDSESELEIGAILKMKDQLIK